MNSLAAIIVTYQPNRAMLREVFAAVAAQVDYVFVVDNCSEPELVEFIRSVLPGSATLCCRDSNTGVAAAFNYGLQQAEAAGVAHAILFDQDSVPQPGMVAELLAVMQEKQRRNEKVAAVGPRYVDKSGQLEPAFVCLSGWKLKRIPCNSGSIVAVDHLISSGCLISMAALACVGPMDERLFIDYVDTEWCLRARRAGYQLYGVGSALMVHSIGEGAATLLGRQVPVHSSLRNYYKLRNGVWLLRQPWVSNVWRVADSRRLLQLYIAFSFFIGNRFENWKMMTLGIWHGLSGRMGKFDY